jgi:hypothetical protein
MNSLENLTACSVCRTKTIPTPANASLLFSFTCKTCCDAVMRSRSEDEAQQFVNTCAEIDGRPFAVQPETFAYEYEENYAA